MIVKGRVRKGGYLEGSIALPECRQGTRLTLTISTHQDEDTILPGDVRTSQRSPLKFHPSIIHVVRFNFKKPRRKWQTSFRISFIKTRRNKTAPECDRSTEAQKPSILNLVVLIPKTEKR